MQKKIVILLFVLVTVPVTAQKNITHNYFDWLFGIEDSLNFRNKQIAVGMQLGKSDLYFDKVNRYSNYANIMELRLAYEDIYSVKYDNPYNFVNYFGIQIFGGVSLSPDNELDFGLEGSRFGFKYMGGIGYDFDGIIFIPYFVKGSVMQSVELENENDEHLTLEKSVFFGSSRESGFMLNMPSGLGFNIAYSNNLFSKTNSFLRKMGSTGIEWAVGQGVTKLLYAVCKQSKLFPIYNFLARSVVGFTFLSLKRKEANFPFGGGHHFSMNSLKIGFNYRFDFSF